MPDDSKLTSARARYQQNRTHLTSCKDSLTKIAGLSTPPVSPHIFCRFQYSPADEQAERGLRAQFVEPLLQQASGLVDRVLGEDTTYRQLRIDQLNLRLDLQELETLQDINDDEVAAGLFQVPYWEANTALESDKALKKAQTDLANWIQLKSAQQTKLSAWSTENAQQPLATGWEGKMSQHQLRLFGGFTAPGDQVPAGAKATDGNIIGGIISYQLADYGFSYQQQQFAAQAAPIDARSVPLTSRVTYLRADAGFKERRKIAAHQKLADKLDAVQLPNGPLNYADRIAAIEERAAFDLRQAYRRLRVLRQGLRMIYGLDTPELPEAPFGDSAQIGVDFLDQIVLWIRRISILLQDVYNSDQEIVSSFSLLERCTSEKFHEGRKRGYWEFEIGPEHFRDLGLVRLRGISAAAESGCHFYNLIASAPRESVIVHHPESAPSPVTQRVDECWIGRVPPLSAHIRPDVAGTRALWNASPVGRWRLRAAPETSLEHIKDIQLNLHVVAQRFS
jgi:hypothetical protein